MLNHTAKMIYYDIESTKSRFIREQYGAKIYDNRFKWQELVRPFSLLGAAWKRVGDDKLYCVSVSSKNPYNDEEVVRKLHSVLSDADILIGHNSDKFDYKKFNARAIYYNLPPIAPKQSIDTLKVAKKHFGFEFNSLGYLASYLGIELKDESPNWDKITSGCAIELANMREYNKQDVISGEMLYLKLRAWMDNHPNVSLYTPIKDIEGKKLLSCKACNSMNYRKYGFHYHKASKTQRYQCLDCKTIFSGEKIKL
jgi:hypothetical protein